MSTHYPNQLHSTPARTRRDPQELGRLGEDLAAAYLQSKGYIICERNVPFKEGEIDIIAQSESGQVCFVEVKTRTGRAFGLEESVSPRKLRRLRLAAVRWLESKPYAEVRFDVIAVLVAEGLEPQLTHVKGVDRGAC